METRLMVELARAGCGNEKTPKRLLRGRQGCSPSVRPRSPAGNDPRNGGGNHGGAHSLRGGSRDHGGGGEWGHDGRSTNRGQENITRRPRVVNSRRGPGGGFRARPATSAAGGGDPAGRSGTSGVGRRQSAFLPSI